MKFLNRFEPLSLLLLRLALGIIFVFHGYPKLAHLGGGMQSFFTQHGLPGYFVYFAGIVETFGGALLILGLFTRAAALLLAIEMCVAIWKVHLVHGVMGVNDYQFPLTLATACFVLATIGAGMISVDWPLLEGGSARRRAPKK